MGRQICGYVGRNAGTEGLAQSEQGAWLKPEIRVRAQHLKAKGTLRRATVRVLTNLGSLFTITQKDVTLGGLLSWVCQNDRDVWF